MSKQSRRMRQRAIVPKPTNRVELEHVHRYCVSVGWMKLEYSRSKDFEICDEGGEYNPTGKFVKRLSNGKIEPIRGQCSYEFLEDGKTPNPEWDGCPFGDSKTNVLPPPSIERIEALIEQDMGEEFVVNPIIIDVQTEKHETQSLESPELEANMARLDALLKKRKEAK